MENSTLEFSPFFLKRSAVRCIVHGLFSLFEDGKVVSFRETEGESRDEDMVLNARKDFRRYRDMMVVAVCKLGIGRVDALKRKTMRSRWVRRPKPGSWGSLSSSSTGELSQYTIVNLSHITGGTWTSGGNRASVKVSVTQQTRKRKRKRMGLVGKLTSSPSFFCCSLKSRVLYLDRFSLTRVRVSSRHV